MKKAKKESRGEHEVVCVVEWQNGDDRRWLFTKRPDKGGLQTRAELTLGLLAGLFQPPTTPIPADTDPASRLSAAIATVSALIDQPKLETVSSHRHIGSIPHIFSHINMTYHITHLTITTATLPATTALWLDGAGVESANVGTGVKKVWSEIYSSWGSFDASRPAPTATAKKARGAAGGAKRSAAKPTDRSVEVGGKIVKKIMMPAMPVRVSKG
jgi:A/G-specific adenine glycosylase